MPCDRTIEDGRPELNAVPSTIVRASAAVKRGVFRLRPTVKLDAPLLAFFAFAVRRLLASFFFLIALAIAALLAFVK